MFLGIYTWTSEVMIVRAGWLQSRFSLTNLCFMTVVASPSSALPGLSFLWPHKTKSSLQPLKYILVLPFFSRSHMSTLVFLPQNDQCSLLLFGFLKSPDYDH